MAVPKQALTRVSISRNSRREMTHSFPSQAGEVNFHISFSSRFSRFWEKKFSFSSRFSRFYIEIHFLLSIFKIFKMKYWYWKSLSLLDCQYNFLLSPINILKVLSPTFRWQTFGPALGLSGLLVNNEILFLVPHLLYLMVWGVIPPPLFGTPHHHHHHNKKGYTCGRVLWGRGQALIYKDCRCF